MGNKHEEMAKYIYSLTTDIDWMDYSYSMDEDVKNLKNEIDKLDKESVLYWVLETLTDKFIDGYYEKLDKEIADIIG